MRKWLLVSIGALVLLSGCTAGRDTTLINGKEYTTEDIKALVNDDGYQYAIKDKVLTEVLGEYYGDVDASKEYTEYEEHLVVEGVSWTGAEAERLKEQMAYSLRLQKVYDKLIEIPDEDVDKAFAEGYPVIEVENAVMSLSAMTGDKDAVWEVDKQLKEVDTDKEYDDLRNHLEHEELAGMERSEMTKDTIIPGFEAIFEVKVGDTVVFGEGLYMSVMKLVSKRDASKEEIYENYRNKEILGKYPDVKDLLYAMEKEYKGLRFSKEVRVLLETES